MAADSMSFFLVFSFHQAYTYVPTGIYALSNNTNTALSHKSRS